MADRRNVTMGQSLNTPTHPRGCNVSALVVGCILLLAAMSAQAQTTTTFVSNIGKKNINQAFFYLEYSQPFTTGSNSAGYRLTSIDISPGNSDAGKSFAASLYTTNASSHPDTLVANLTAPGTFPGAGRTLTFTAPANTTLAANTTYTVRMRRNGGRRGAALGATSSDAEDPGAAAGWSIANESSRISGTNWIGGHHTVSIAIKGIPNDAGVSGARIISTPNFGDTYGLNETLEVEVQFSRNVAVTGSPQLALSIGGAERIATYHRGSGTNRLVFRYTVTENLQDSDGLTLSSTPLRLNGGTIRSTASALDAYITLADLMTLQPQSQKVDGSSVRTAPEVISIVRQTPSSASTNGNNLSPENTLQWRVTFSEPVVTAATDFSVTNVAGARVTAVTAVSGITGIYAEVWDVTVSGSEFFKRQGRHYQFRLNPVSANIRASSTHEDYELDNIRPVLTISDVPNLITGPFTATFAFQQTSSADFGGAGRRSDAVTGFGGNDIVLTNARVLELTPTSFEPGGDAWEYEARITPTAAGPITLVVADNATRDAAGNGNTGARVTSTSTYTEPVCARPDFGTRRNIWTGAVTVGEISGSAVLGFSGSIGSLDDKTFTIGSNGYEIDAATVVLTDTLTRKLSVSLKDADLTSAETAALRLHVCNNTPYDFSVATHESVTHSYDWAASSLDWSGVSTRTLYLSLPANNAATGAPTISGAAAVGSLLSAVTGTTADTDGLPSSFTYQWVRVDADGTSNPEDIPGATSSAYTLTAADVGKRVNVRVGFTDNLGSQETRTSDAYPATGTVMVTALPTFSIGSASDGSGDATGVEGATIALTVKMSAAAASDVTVKWRFVADTATAGDYSSAADETLTIPAGDTSATLSIDITDDDRHENREQFAVELFEASGATLSRSSAAITIEVDADNPDTPRFRIEVPSTVNEGDPVLAARVVHEAFPSDVADITITISTANGSAQSPGDYGQLVNHALTFPKGGSTTNKVDIPIVDDDIFEGDETFEVRFSAPSIGEYTAASQTTHTITIVDEDSQPEVTIAADAATVTEGIPVVFTLTRTGGTTQALTVNLTVSETQEVVADNDEGTQQVTFAAGEATATLSVATVLDSTDEDDSVVTAMVTADSNSPATYTPGTPASAAVTVTADSTAPRVASIVRQVPAHSPTNADSLTWRVRFSEVVEEVDAADFALTGSTATLAVSAVSAVMGGYDVTASDGDLAALNDTVTLSFATDQNIQDAAGNALVNTAPTGANDASYAVDNTPPTVAIAAGTTPVTEGMAAEFTLTRSGVMTDAVTVNLTVSETGDVMPARNEGSRRLTFRSGDAAGTTSSSFCSEGICITSEAGVATIRLSVATVADSIDEADSVVSVTLAVDSVDPATYTLGSPASATVTVADNDTRGVTVSASALTIDEGGSDTYTVVLDSQPTGEVTITPSSDNSEVTLSPATLSFTAGNWDTEQTVTVSAAEDADTTDDSATIAHGVAGAGSDYAASAVTAAAVTVTVTDNDTAAASCAAPDFGTRRNIWTGTVTVGAFMLDGTTISYGFFDAIGDLDNKTFAIGSNDYEIDAAGVSMIASTKVLVSLDSDLTTAEKAVLRLHVCATSYDFSAADGEASNHSYTWNAPGLDWSSLSSRTLYLSLPANNVATGTPTISGTATVGQTLAAVTTGLADTDGLPSTFTYQWTRLDADGTSNPLDIPGATANSYTLTAADVGKRVNVRVSFTDSLSGRETRTSAAWPATGTVVAAALPAVTVTAGAEVDEGDDAEFTLTLSAAAPAGGLSVSYSLALTNPNPVADRAHVAAANLGNRTATVAAGETTATVTVATVDVADLVSRNSTLTLSLTAGAGYELGSTAAAEVTIDDTTTANVTYLGGACSATVGEGDGSVALGVELDRDVAFPVGGILLVDIPRSATPVNDYVQADANRSLVFPALTRTSNFQVGIVDNLQLEGDEEFSLRVFSNGLDPAITLNTGCSNNHTFRITIEDDDTVELSISAPTPVTEGDAIRVTVAPPTGSCVLPFEVTVTLTPSGDTNGLGSAAAKSLRLPPCSGATANFATASDSVQAADRSLLFTLSLPDGTDSRITLPATPGAAVTIEDDDTRGVTISESALTMDENGSGTYTVVLDSQPTAQVTITPSSDNSDVTFSPAVLTFTADNWDTAQTVTVSAAEDADSANDNATIAHGVAGVGSDYAANAVTAAAVAVTVTDNDTADSTAPRVTSIEHQSPTTSPTNADSLSWRLRFSEAVENVDAADFALSGSTATLAVSAVSASEYTVTASGGNLAALNGTATLSFAAAQNIQDLAGNALASTTPTGANNADYAMDNTAPTLAISGVPATSDAPFTATFTFSEDITGFVAGDITPDNATLSAFTTTSATVYTARVTPAADGSVTLDVAADVARDAAGNGNSAAARASSSYTAPAVTVTVAAGAEVDEGADAEFTLTLSAAAPAGGLSVSYSLALINPNPVADRAHVAAANLGDRTATVAAGETTATVTVATVDVADLVSRNSTLTLSLTAGAGYQLGSTAAAAVTIDDTTTANVTYSGGACSATVNEADSTLALGVELDKDVAFPVGGILLVNIPASAGAGNDYVQADADRSLVFPALTRTKNFTVGIVDNLQLEGDEAFTIHLLRNGLDPAITLNTGCPNDNLFTITITDDDTAALSISAPTPVTEGDAIRVTVAPPSGSCILPFPVTVTLTPSGDTNGLGSAAAKSLRLPPCSGATADFATASDSVQAADRSLLFTLSLPDGTDSRITLPATPGAAVTIEDDDTRGVTLSTPALTIDENGSDTYTVVLDSQPTAQVTITPSSDNSDVTFSPATLSFTADNWDTAQTVTVSAAEDADSADDNATIAHGVAGVGSDYAANAVTAAAVAVTVTDNDSADSTAPQVTSIVRQVPAISPTNADSLTWRLTFSEAVENVDAADFALSGSTATLAVSAVSAVMGGYDITASGGNLAEFNGTVTLSFATGQNIQDLAGNALANTTPTGANNADYALDNTAPTLAISGVPATSDAPFTATFTFSEDITGFVAGDISLVNARLSAFTTTSGAVYTALITPAANGSVTLDVAADVAQDAAGNGNSAAARASSSYTAPTLPAIRILPDPPTVTEGTAASFSLIRSGAPITAPLTVTVTVSENGDVIATADEGVKQVTFEAGVASALLSVTTIDDAVVEDDSVVTAAVMTDTAVPATYTPSSLSTAAVTVRDNDTRGVTVSEFDLTVNEGGSGTYTVVLDSQPTGDVTVTPSVTGDSDVTFSPAVLTFTAGNWDRAQTLTVSAAEDADSADDSATITHAVAGADYALVSAAEVSVTVTDNDPADSTAPRVVSIVRQVPTTSPTNADSLSWRVTFSEAVENIDAADFALSGTTATLTVSAVSAVMGGYDVTASGGNLAALDGTATLSFAAAQNIQDLAGNALANTTPTGANDAGYAIDNTAPTLVISGVPATSDAPFTATFTFSEDITGFVAGDISLVNATLSAFTTTSGAVYTALITPAANGSVTLDVAADVARDAAGNGNSAAARASSRYTASTLPVITISAGTTPLTEGTAAAFTLSRTGATTAALTVNVGVTESGEMVAAADKGTQSVTFGTGSASATLSVATLGDTTGEDDSVVTATVADDSADPATYTPGSPATATVTVRDNDTFVVEWVESALTLTEDVHTASNPVSIQVRISGLRQPGSGEVILFTVQTAAADGATPGTDFQSLDLVDQVGGFEFSRGSDGIWSATKTYQIASIADSVDEPDETFTVTLSNPRAAPASFADVRLGETARATVTIEDDDLPDTTRPALTGATVNGDRLEMVFSEALDESSVPSRSRFVVRVGSANNIPQSVRISAATVILTLSTPVEAGNSVSFDYRPPSSNPLRDLAGNSVQTTGSCPGGILCIQGFRVTNTTSAPLPVVTIAAGTTPVAEGTAAAFTLSRTGATTAALTVNVSVTESGDVVASDDEGAGQVTFAAGEASATLSVATVDDSIDETDSEVSVTLAENSASYTLGASTSASVMVEDDDSAGVTISEPALSVDEGGSGSYTVVLDSQPTGEVTVTPSVTGDSDVTISPATLTFTATDWNRAQEVTVSAAEDDDTTDDSAMIAHGVAGADYTTVTATEVSVTVTDNDTAGVTISESDLSVDEGGSDSYTVVLDSQPTGEVTVTPSVTGDSDITVSAALIFTASNWDTEQTVTVSAAEDADAAQDNATITHNVAGADYTAVIAADMPVTVTDNDTAGVTLSKSDLTVAEGGSDSYTVVLDSQPTGEVTVTPSVTGDSDVTVSAALTFTTSNWNTAQTVTVSAAEDADSADDNATIAHAVVGADYALVTAAEVSVTVTDNDPVDSTAPRVASIVRQSPTTSPTNADSLSWRVTFSEAVENVDAADFALSGSTATLAVSAVSASEYEVTASGGNLAGLNGTATLSFAAGQNIQDLAGNALANTTPTGANNADYAIDNTAPTLAISGVPATSDAPFTATFTFSEGVEGFSLSGIVLGNATASDFTSTSRAVYTALITPTANGVVTVDVAARAAVDSVGHFTTAATQVRSTYTAPTLPVITISAGATLVTEGTAAAFTLSRTGATTAALTVGVNVTETGEMVAAANKGTQSVTFETGSASATLSVATLGDTTGENDSAVTATVAADTANPATYTPGTPALAAVAVSDDDGGLPALSITASSPSVTEGADAVFVVRSAAPVTSDIDVTVQIQASPTSLLTMPGGLSLSGTAGTRVDIGPVRILLGQSEVTIRIPSGPVLQTVLGGVVSQGYLTATLVKTPAYGVETPGFAEVRLDAMVDPVDVLPEVTLALQDTASAVTEGDTIGFVISRPAPPAPLQVDDLLALEVNVRYHLSTVGVSDPVFDTVTLEAGTLEKIVTIPTPDNEVVDPGRVLTVALVSGTGYTISDTASVTVTVTDNDSAGVTVSESALSVDEGGSDTYTVVLTSQPTGEVTITPSSNNSEVTVSPSTLTFTATDWSTAQTVTVSAAEDADAAQDSATITHNVAGADYTAVIAADVPVTVTDNDTAGVTLSKSDLTVAEGGSDTYTVVLTSQPTAEVTVTPSVTGDSDVTVSAALTFTTDNWNTAQEVTVSAAQDDDTTDDSATVAHAVAGADYALVTAAEVSVTVTDNDSAGVTVSTPALSVDEGGTGSYTVVLNSQPTGQVTVTPSVTGDSDVTVSAALTFTTGNWDRAQTVTVSAAEDDDAENDSAAIAHGVAGADYASVRAANVVVTVTDNDTADSTAPRLVSIKRVLTSPTNADRLTWRVRFSEAVRDVDAVDFALSGTSATLMVISTSSVRDYIVTASGGDLAGLDGTASLSLAAVQNIQDLAGNALANTTPTGTSNADYAIDNTAPTLAISGVPATSDAPFTATFTFSEDITGFAVDDITPDNATLSAFSAISATVYTARITPTADGTVTLDVAADVAEDTAGNGNTAAVRASSRYTASTLPVITISADTTPLTEGTAAAFTLSRTGATTTALTVGVNVTETGTMVATANKDAQQVTFEADSATATLSVATVADSLDEDDSVVTVTVADDSADPATYTPGTPASATVTVTDDDSAGVTVSTPALTVDEGGLGTYTVVLTSQPTAEVTVTPSVTGDSDVTVSAALTFTTGNWDTAQTVTVSAAEDADSADDNATIIHSVAGGNYASVTAAAVSVTVTDNDTAPRLVSIELVSPTNADRLWRVTFSEAVQNVDAADFALSVTTATLAQETSRKAALTVLIALSGTTATLAQETSRIAATLIVRAISASEYIVTVRGDDLATLSGRVRVTLSLAMDQNIQDTAGNALVNTMPTGTNDASHEVDNTPPPQAPNRPATGAPVIEGALTVASVLTADTSQIRDADGLDGVVYRYQWLRIDGAGNGRGEREIAGATEGRYRISEQDIGHRLRLRVAFADARGNPEQLYSAPTAAVSVVSREVAQAWLGRFGRTVSEQVLTVVDGRLHSSREAGSSLRLAGHEMAQESADKAGYKPDDGWGWRVRDEAEEGLYGAYGGRGVSGREWLTGSSFNVTSGSEAGDYTAFWGGVAANRFSGQQEAVAIEGEVISGQVGADWRRHWGTAGLLLSHARGEGDYRVDDDSGKIESTLTGVYPFVGYTLNDRTSLWGVAGYGSGESRYRSAEGGGWYTSDLSLSLAAAGIRTVVRPTVAGSGLELSLVADGLLLRTESDASLGIAAESARVNRVRTGLEGRWHGLGSGLTPVLELGLRHDGGDVEKGFGADLGGGVDWHRGRFELQVRGRGLLTHEDSAFRNRGFSGMMSWQSQPSSSYGLKLRMQQSVGGSATGGVAALHGRETMAGLDVSGSSQESPLSSRTEMSVAYGMPFGRYFIGTPEVGLGITDQQQDYRVGWRLDLRRNREIDFALGLEVRRRENLETEDAGYEATLQLRANW